MDDENAAPAVLRPVHGSRSGIPNIHGVALAGPAESSRPTASVKPLIAVKTGNTNAKCKQMPTRPRGAESRRGARRSLGFISPNKVTGDGGSSLLEGGLTALQKAAVEVALEQVDAGVERPDVDRGTMGDVVGAAGSSDDRIVGRPSVPEESTRESASSDSGDSLDSEIEELHAKLMMQQSHLSRLSTSAGEFQAAALVHYFSSKDYMVEEGGDTALLTSDILVHLNDDEREKVVALREAHKKNMEALLSQGLDHPGWQGLRAVAKSCVTAVASAVSGMHPTTPGGAAPIAASARSAPPAVHESAPDASDEVSLRRRLEAALRAEVAVRRKMEELQVALTMAKTESQESEARLAHRAERAEALALALRAEVDELNVALESHERIALAEIAAAEGSVGSGSFGDGFDESVDSSSSTCVADDLSAAVAAVAARLDALLPSSPSLSRDGSGASSSGYEAASCAVSDPGLSIVSDKASAAAACPLSSAEVETDEETRAPGSVISDDAVETASSVKRSPRSAFKSATTRRRSRSHSPTRSGGFAALKRRPLYHEPEELPDWEPSLEVSEVWTQDVPDSGDFAGAPKTPPSRRGEGPPQLTPAALGTPSTAMSDAEARGIFSSLAATKVATLASSTAGLAATTLQVKYGRLRPVERVFLLIATLVVTALLIWAVMNSLARTVAHSRQFRPS